MRQLCSLKRESFGNMANFKCYSVVKHFMKAVSETPHYPHSLDEKYWVNGGNISLSYVLQVGHYVINSQCHYTVTAKRSKGTIKK